MRMKTTHLVYAILAVALLAFAAPAKAETTICTEITSIPTTISSSGVYCLKQDFNSLNLSSQVAITITADNVTVDLNGFTLDTSASGTSDQSTGIYAADQNNVNVRNGTVIGFYTGDLLNAGSGHIVEDILAYGILKTGLNIKGTGITIRNNRVVNTGGSTHGTSSHGIASKSEGGTITNNTISETSAKMTGVGLLFSDSTNATVKGNRIHNTGSTDTGGASKGMIVRNVNNSILENNIITGVTSDLTTYGFFEDTSSSKNQYINNRVSDVDTGISCLDSTGKARDNYFNNITTKISTCTDNGNND